MSISPQDILFFWFGPSGDAVAMANRQSALWWSKDERIDADMRERFETTVRTAADGHLDHWLSTAEGRLALILLADQFPHNIWRDTPAAFSLDPMARKLCKEGITNGDDRALSPLQRVFFYLPLEHSEDVADQALSVRKFRELASEVEPALMKTFAFFLTYANRHESVIARFGRFPHRNAILGRDSTPEELAYLAEPGSGF